MTLRSVTGGHEASQDGSQPDSGREGAELSSQSSFIGPRIHTDLLRAWEEAGIGWGLADLSRVLGWSIGREGLGRGKRRSGSTVEVAGFTRGAVGCGSVGYELRGAAARNPSSRAVRRLGDRERGDVERGAGPLGRVYRPTCSGTNRQMASKQPQLAGLQSLVNMLCFGAALLSPLPLYILVILPFFASRCSLVVLFR